MSKLQNLLDYHGFLRVYSGTSSTGVSYEVWSRAGIAFIIDNNRADGEMDSILGLYKFDHAVRMARRLTDR